MQCQCAMLPHSCADMPRPAVMIEFYAGMAMAQPQQCGLHDPVMGDNHCPCRCGRLFCTATRLLASPCHGWADVTCESAATAFLYCAAVELTCPWPYAPHSVKLPSTSWTAGRNSPAFLRLAASLFYAESETCMTP